MISQSKFHHNLWRHFPSFWTLLIVSALLRVGLILYSEWLDARSVVKYTDVDYRVFSDAARFLFHPVTDSVAQGPLSRRFSLSVGNPYIRETYRYTPLLAVLLLPNEVIHASFGKYLFAACDLINGVLIYRLLLSSVLSLSTAWTANDAKPLDEQHKSRDTEDAPVPDKKTWAAFLAATHLLNPLVFSISTRGSSESILCTLVLLTLYSALHRRWDAAAVMLGISTHWKIYPVIYGVSCVTAIAAQTRPASGWGFAFVKSLVCMRTLRFTILSTGTFFLLGASCYAIWGYPFLYEAYLYHTNRLDHRHNFSPYFYLTYLTYPGQSPGLLDGPALSFAHRCLQSPLMSLVPQLSLSLGAGVLLGRRIQDLPFAWFVQTFAFVLFNRVCTSQYFLWYTLFLPLLASRVRVSWWIVVIWAGVQAVWLAEAYKLEFLGENVFFGLWLRSLLYVGGHAWVLGNIMEAYVEGMAS